MGILRLKIMSRGGKASPVVGVCCGIGGGEVGTEMRGEWSPVGQAGPGEK